MKRFFLLAGLVFFSAGIFAQQQYEVIREQDGTKILKGFISKDIIAQDTSFAWFAQNQKDYTPYAAAVEALRKYGSNLQIVAFIGTWCHDTQFILPKFFRLLDAAGFPQERLTVFGVDRDKKTTSHIADAFNVINVPAFIVMKDGKEIGRVVEYGKYGMWDKELGEVVTAAGITTPASN